LQVVKSDKDAADERKVLAEFLALVEKESKVSANAKAAQEALTTKVVAKYAKLTDDDIKALVVDDKWLAGIEAAVLSELTLVSQVLTDRARELAARYARPLSSCVVDIEVLAARVARHLDSIRAAR
jgi:type I restriction enzyme M protein